MLYRLKTTSIMAFSAMALVLTGCQVSETTNQSTEISVDSTTTTMVVENQNLITKAGTYHFSGTITESIVVEVTKDEDVEIVLDNANISSRTNAPIYIKEAKNVQITLPKSSKNTVTDNRPDATDDSGDDYPNAAIYSMANLKIQGADNAVLQVFGNYNDGITSKDDLEFKEANIEVTAKDDGVRGKDTLEIDETTLVVNAGGDGLQSDNIESETKGIITFKESDVTITAGDDGIHGVQLVSVLSGTINILDSYEGIEGLQVIVDGGTVNITANDDGINVAAKKEEGDATGGMSGAAGEAVVAGGLLAINGGIVSINSASDGFDSNGNAVVTGGMLIINGPTTEREGPLDVNGTFLVSGGTIIAVGSVGMAGTPDAESEQYSIQVNLDTVQAAETEVALVDAVGQELFSFTPAKTFQSVTYSSSQIKAGETYTFLVDGEAFTDLVIDGKITKYGEGETRGVPGGTRGGLF